ncbi:sodium/glutamate symporter [uncultured Tateyamaria sp.]|uniref:sodium/glutamate symporter n=1 Tax=uncultured Tateyamaria sp. TaxID=455651 RepID=UPI002616124D|nr:sodium/glutamate symporter [uncultured Tateyamaria sp.]
MTLVVPAFITATLGLAVFLFGTLLNGWFEILRRFNIPEPVSGGLFAAVVGLLLYVFLDVQFAFEMEVRDFFLVLFFAGIGLNARFNDLLSGGKPLAVLLFLTLIMILVQNGIGTAGAVLLGYPAATSVLFGSAALIGGHGTAIAWSPDVAAASGLTNAPELGIAVATLGLVLAALIGGPIARYLVEGKDLTPDRPDEGLTVGLPADNGPTTPIDPVTVSRVLLYLNLAIIGGYSAHLGLIKAGVKLPLFVPCLIMAILIANIRTALFPTAQPVARTPALALISEIALGAFLAMSLMSLQLWTLVELGTAIGLILAVQTLATLAFVIFILFPLMGGGYRAAVLGAGFGGFALGATPTAIANMTAVTKRYGPSPMAFVILPLVSAFFVDIANAIAIQFFVNL